MRVDGGRIRLAVDTARHGHERFGVSPHAVLADVEALHLLTHADAQANGLLDDPEKPVAEHEHSYERRDDGNNLDAKLVEAPGVEKAALADAVELRQRGS